MSDIVSSQPRTVPLDIIFLIIEATLPPLPIGSCDYSASKNLIVLNRTIHAAMIARIYHTVVVSTSSKLRKFRAVLSSSSHLCPLVHNLWINHESGLRNAGRYAITNNMLATIKLTTNLRRLAIMTPLYHDSTHLTSIELANLVHLVVPSLWLVGPPDGGGVSMFSQFPKDLTALYIRGRAGPQEANEIVAHCPALRYVTLKVFAAVQQSELIKFTQILVRELKQLVSLELLVHSWCADTDKSVPADERVSVHTANDGDSEMDLWMSESGLTRPTWARS